MTLAVRKSDRRAGVVSRAVTVRSWISAAMSVARANISTRRTRKASNGRILSRNGTWSPARSTPRITSSWARTVTGG